MGDIRFWGFKNGTAAEATLYVYGDIVTYDLGDWNLPDNVVPNKFKEELKALGDIKTLHVRINSGGGSAFAAMAIMNLLKTHKAKVITYNDGIAASAATIIAMAGDKIVTALGSVWMIHLPVVGIAGYYGAGELEKQAEALHVLTDTLADIYHAKTGIDKGELKNMMADETWMSGTEALQKGFADEGSDIAVAASLNMDKRTALFNGVEVDLRGVHKMDKAVALINTRGASGAQNKKREIIMNLEDLREKYPDLYAAARRDGFSEGVTSERSRIKEIHDMTMPGMNEIADKAMFEEPVDGATFAKNMLTAQKTKGANYLNNAWQDAQQLNAVPGGPAPDDAQRDLAERTRLLNIGKRVAEEIRLKAPILADGSMGNIELGESFELVEATVAKRNAPGAPERQRLLEVARRAAAAALE